MIHTYDTKFSPRTLFFLIHGYTGSSTDFNEFSEYLQNTYSITVKSIILIGHSSKIEDLDGVEYDDFLSQVENEFKKYIGKYDKIFIGGVSFGAQLSLILASRYKEKVSGVFNVCAPYKLKFPFNIPFLRLLGKFKKYWRKSLSKKEQRLRRRSSGYKEMHINGLNIIKKANKELDVSLPRIICPVLTIQSTNDPIGDYKVIKKLDDRLNTIHIKKIFNNKNHNLFFADERYILYKEIGRFFETSLSAETKDIGKEKIAAIVPAYNEETTIGKVLSVLAKTELLDEIIVIDDGSSDNTSKEAKKFSKVKLLRNNKNKGKAYSMQVGVDATDAGAFFFCDADLDGLTTGAVEQIITPVLDGRYDMYIGIRNNLIQKAILLFAVNSGERAVSRKLWDRLPENFKFRYRVEAGLNFIAKTEFGGYGQKKFDYYQTLKEKKYGFLKGMLLRWWMNFDVGYAYLLVFLRKKKGHRQF